MTEKSPIAIIGRNVAVSFGSRAVDVPAKVDTGADSSSLWATNIRVGEDGKLRFSLFGEGSPYYNGKVFVRDQYTVAKVRNSTGHLQIRYQTQFVVKVAGRKIRVTFNLSDRSKNTYPILLGRRAINKKFLVDVSKAEINDTEKDKAADLRVELESDPIKFHRKYFKKS